MLHDVIKSLLPISDLTVMLLEVNLQEERWEIKKQGLQLQDHGLTEGHLVFFCFFLIVCHKTWSSLSCESTPWQLMVEASQRTLSREAM